MEMQGLNYDTIDYELALLENSLLERSDRDLIWPVAELSAANIQDFVHILHQLAWEATAMYLRCDMPGYRPNFTKATHVADYPELIALTRAFVQRCNENLILEYRSLTEEEDRVILLLQQLHSALIGHYYFQHPGLETVSAHEVRFFKG